MIRGVLLPIITPFDDKGRVDEPIMRQLVDFHIGAGVQGLFVLGSTGQGPAMSTEERKQTAAGPHPVQFIFSDASGRELAMPSALRSERRAAIKALEPFPVVVKTLPALEEIASGRVEVSDLRPIEVEDLLGRDPVAPELELLTGHVKDKVVMITGAGGSIGSELCRPIARVCRTRAAASPSRWRNW